jgi:hypothetical protein
MCNQRKIVAFTVVLFLSIATFLALEGLLSVLAAWRTSGEDQNVKAEASLKDRAYCVYDPLLGWDLRANSHLEDFYGPSKGFFTNSKRFRNREEFSTKVPEGKIRIVCSGDSFTMGHGVTNESAWCNSLPQLDPRLEAINLGVGGYGLDQAFLRYRQDTLGLEHQIHICAFILDDIMRATTDNFFGFGKPYFKVINGELQLKNVPVPENNFHWPVLELRLRLFVEELSIAKSIRHWLKQKLEHHIRVLNENEAIEMVSKLFESVSMLSNERRAELILVILPIASDYDDKSADQFRKTLFDIALKKQITCLDLTRVLKSRLVRSEWNDLFIDRTGHFSEKGNQVVAQLIYSALVQLKFIPS